MTWGRTGEWPGRTPAWRRYQGPACPSYHTSPLPMECKTSPTLGIWVPCSGACRSLLQGLLHQPKDTTHSMWQSRVVSDGQIKRRRFAYVPASNKDVSRSGVGKVSGETMTSLHTHTQVGTMTDVEYLIL